MENLKQEARETQGQGWKHLPITGVEGILEVPTPDKTASQDQQQLTIDDLQVWAIVSNPKPQQLIKPIHTHKKITLIPTKSKILVLNFILFP